MLGITSNDARSDDREWGQTVVAGLLQATSLPFIVAASMIGVELGLLDAATSAGLLSVLIFPLVALTILRRAEPVPAPAALEPLPPIGAGRATLEGA